MAGNLIIFDDIYLTIVKNTLIEVMNGNAALGSDQCAIFISYHKLVILLSPARLIHI